jgi:hypothetical protein
MQEFPKWMYHRTEPARIVDDPIEQDALGPDWAETPAAFDVPKVPVVVEDIGGEADAPAIEDFGFEEVRPAAATASPKTRRGR